MFKFSKRIAGVALSVSLLGAGAAQASVPLDTLVVGGIEYGASESYVRSVYGAPREVETKYNPIYAGGQATEWEYGNDFDIIFVDGRGAASRLARRTEFRPRRILLSVQM